MRRRVGFLTVLLVLALVGTGCLDIFTAKPVKVSGIVTIDGAAPGDMVVQIAVVGSKEKATASGDGAFELELKPGKYELQASGEGVKMVSVNIVVQKNKPLTGVTIDVESVEPDKFYLAMDFSNDDHLALIEKPWDTINYEIKNDPFGDLAWFFPKGTEDQAPPAPMGFKDMRFALVNTPIMETFRISIDQLGEGAVTSTAPGGNRSLSIVFGYEDPSNWWVAYYTYTKTTRVAQMKDGAQINVCRPEVADQWIPNNDQYQTAEIVLERDGDEMVLRAYANGEPISIDGCRFPADDYTPGKIGFGGHSTSSAQSWYFRNVIIEEL